MQERNQDSPPPLPLNIWDGEFVSNLSILDVRFGHCYASDINLFQIATTSALVEPANC